MVSDTSSLGVGVAGLGRAFTLMVPTLTRHPRVRMVAAADPRVEARERFARDFGGRAYTTVEELCGDPAVQAVYVATPHQHHAAHVIAAAKAGKHVLVEKPLALTLDEARRMLEAVAAAGVRMVVGHSHSFDAPIARVRAIVASGEVGRPRMVTSINFTDFLYRPRRPEELDTAQGGGVLFSQAAHQVDIVRLLAGGQATTVRCLSGAWDPARPTEGAYSALISFEGGCFATITYSGYGRFDSDELCDWVSEIGHEKDPKAYGDARAALKTLAGSQAEAAGKDARNFGGDTYRDATRDAPWHEHFGPLVVACERGDLRPTSKGVWIYGDETRRFEALAKPAVPRAEVVDELCDAILLEKPALHDGRWGLATLEVCLAMLESSRSGKEVSLRHQVAMG